MSTTDIDQLAVAIDNWATEKGWNETNRDFSEWIALIHTEVSEAYEEYRKKGMTLYYEEKDGKPEGIAIELADTLIRILHFFGRQGISPSKFIGVKMKYNEQRPYRHGGKLA